MNNKKKEMTPRQNSLSTSARSKSGFPMDSRYSSTLALAFLLLLTLVVDRCSSQVTYSSSQDVSVLLDFFSFSQFTSPSTWKSSPFSWSMGRSMGRSMGCNRCCRVPPLTAGTHPPIPGPPRSSSRNQGGSPAMRHIARYCGVSCRWRHLPNGR